MAASTYEAALVRLLEHEGGYSNHPSDPGGPTKFGITIHDYRRYVKADAGAEDVRAMPLAHAQAIYRERYWNALRCDELPAGLDYAVFDYGVNSGISRAAKVLQRLLGQAATGVMTDAVIEVARNAETAGLIARLCDERLAFLKSLKTWPVFGAGWGRRVAEVRRDALAMAKGAPVAADTAAAGGGRASVPVATSARAGTAGAVVAAGAGAAHSAHAAGAPFSIVLAILVLSAVFAVAGWIGWTLWRRRRQDAPVVMPEAGAP